MESFMGVIQLLILCGSVLAMAFMILLGLPQSKLRDFLLEIFGWTFAIFCGGYVLSPVDVIPDFVFPIGLIDDGGAAFAGIASAIAAWKAGRDRQLTS